MEINKVLEFLTLTEKIKCHTRHSWTTSGRHESVAEHTFQLCVFAWLVKDEFLDHDMDKVLKMCLFHDLGEAVTGDIPAFVKGDTDRNLEADALRGIEQMLPEPQRSELMEILGELEENQTKEAKLFQALDKMEALIQHNEADISTWLPLEYELQMTYGTEEADAFMYTRRLRDVIRRQSERKIEIAAQTDD